MSNCIRDRLKLSKLTQAWLVTKLAERGIYTNPGELSYILSGVINSPKAALVIQSSNEILDEIGADVDAQRGTA